MIDWTKITLTLLQLAKKKEKIIDPNLLEIKPKVLSDANLLTGLAALKAVLSFIPATTLASHALSLGDVGFKVWKRLALQEGYDFFNIQPVGRATILFKLKYNEDLSPYFSELVEKGDWQKCAIVFDDFTFCTDPLILHYKYPQVSLTCIEKICQQNKKLLGVKLQDIKQVIKTQRNIAEVDHNFEEAIEALENIFPAMKNWAIIQSDSFDEIVEIIDTIF